MSLETNGFSNNPFMIGYDSQIFEGDEDLGFKFPQGKLISSRGFKSLEESVVRIRSGYPTFLNMGDSSTSGWNSNNVYRGNQNPNAPFFSYKTYSELLEEQLFANVLNAGIPGYTSHQGKKYLEKLLKVLAKKDALPDYVTIYFGNNDGTYNQIEDKVRLDGKLPSENSTGERVTVKDYEINMASMIQICRNYGSKPILIVPPVHYDWETGIRSNQHRNESLIVLEKLSNTTIANELEIARKLYLKGRYKNACEMDRVLPRLKEDYKKTLHKIARTTGTAIIDIQKNIPLTRNEEYFADYCHPLEKTNQMIVDEIKKLRSKDIMRKQTKLRKEILREGNTLQMYSLW